MIEKCAHDGCANEADPRWWAYCKRCRRTSVVCDAHPGEGDPLPDGTEHPHPWTAFIEVCTSCRVVERERSEPGPSSDVAERAAAMFRAPSRRPGWGRCACGTEIVAWDMAVAHARTGCGG